MHGDRRGRSLGFPTANVATEPFSALPADGVYAGRFVIASRLLPAAVSVGTNPTFSGRVRTVEAYVLDVDEDFYGHPVARGLRRTGCAGRSASTASTRWCSRSKRDVARARELA